jgi:hypothetical protein
VGGPARCEEAAKRCTELNWTVGPTLKKRSELMVLIKVQYDAYNRQFKLCDGESKNTLTDGETYLLIADLSIKDLALADGVQISANTEHVVA